MHLSKFARPALVEDNAIKGEEYLKKLKVIKDSLISSNKEE